MRNACLRCKRSLIRRCYARSNQDRVPPEETLKESPVGEQHVLEELDVGLILSIYAQRGRFGQLEVQPDDMRDVLKCR